MVIEFVGSEHAEKGNPSAAGVSVARPAGVETGDVLIAFGYRQAFANTEYAMSGWDEVTRYMIASNGTWPVAMFSRVVSDISSEPMTYHLDYTGGVTQSSIGVSVLAFRGADPVSPFASDHSGLERGATSSLTHPGISVSVPDSLLLSARDGANSAGAGLPAGMISLGASATPWFSEFAAEPLVNAGATGARAFTNGGSSRVIRAVFLTALRPAGSGPPPVTARPWWTAQILE